MEDETKYPKIIAGLIKTRQKIEQPRKDKSNPFFKSKYVPLEDVIAVIDAAIENTGLSYIQIPVHGEKAAGVKTLLMAGDEVMATEPFLMPVDKGTAQGYGSALTYARRYSLQTVFGIAGEEDDDGNVASGNYNQSQGRTQQQMQARMQQAQQRQQPSELDRKKAHIKQLATGVRKVLGNAVKSMTVVEEGMQKAGVTNDPTKWTLGDATKVELAITKQAKELEEM